MEGILYVLFFIVVLLGLCVIFRKFFTEHNSELLTAVGGIGLALADIKSDSEEIFVSDYTWKDCWLLIFLISILLLFTAIITTYLKNKRNDNLKEVTNAKKLLEKKLERIKHDYYRLCSDTIKWTFEEFFSNGEARISVYQHQGDHFTLLGRYANKTEFNKFSETEYKDNEGFIALGWQSHEFEDQNAPPWKGSGKDYKTYMKGRSSISNERLSRITMKSCSFFIKTLHDNSTSEDPDGIIVFEKLRPNSIDTPNLQAVLQEKNIQLLSFLKNMKSLTKKLG